MVVSSGYLREVVPGSAGPHTQHHFFQGMTGYVGPFDRDFPWGRPGLFKMYTEESGSLRGYRVIFPLLQKKGCQTHWFETGSFRQLKRRMGKGNAWKQPFVHLPFLLEKKAHWVSCSSL